VWRANVPTYWADELEKVIEKYARDGISPNKPCIRALNPSTLYLCGSAGCTVAKNANSEKTYPCSP
jgi:hypothetical protein